jgi:uncharacterized protein (TIGR02145 family)
MKSSLLLMLFVLITSSEDNGNVTIGTQVWCTENLDVTTFRNGDVIHQAKTNEEWEMAGKKKQPAWCYYNNDPVNGHKYGKLYNWYAVSDSRGLAPEGYHIPSDVEWTKLINYLGGENVAGAKLKSTFGWNDNPMGRTITCKYCADWNAEYRRKVPCHNCQDTRTAYASTSGNGTNISGFIGLPGGFRTLSSRFRGIRDYSVWWSSTVNGELAAWARQMENRNDTILRLGYFFEEGCSVRCIKD